MPIADLNIPILETPRLILRAHRREDFESMVSIWQDPIVVEHFHGVALSREDIWGRFLRGFGMWAVNGFGLWAVEDKATGAYAGTVGAFEVKREMIPPITDMPEAGWTFAARFHGKGYATEAMQAAFQWTDGALPGRAMFCIVAPENKPSIRVAEKCGFRSWYRTAYHEAPTLVFKREPVTIP